MICLRPLRKSSENPGLHDHYYPGFTGLSGWALHGVNWTELWEDIRDLDWRWMAVAAVSDILAYVVQGWRWSLVLRPGRSGSHLDLDTALFSWACSRTKCCPCGPAN